MARDSRAQALDARVWQARCQVLTPPARITQELARAPGGAWLPQALQARQRPLQEALTQRERQQARRLDVSLAEVVGHEECERKRQELRQMPQRLHRQLRQREAQAQQHRDVCALARGIEAFCQRLEPTLNTRTCAQRRQLVE